MVTKKSGNTLVTVNNERVAAQLRGLAEQVQSGAIRGYEFKQTDSSITFTVDSADGNKRMIKHQNVAPGLLRDQTEQIYKQDPAERRQLVKALVEEGMTQVEIAKRTISSQKTISNDIKRLRVNGEL